MSDILIGRNDDDAVSLEARCGNRQGMIETMGKQVVRTIGSQPGRQILHDVPGGIFGAKR
ncbi:hypothetical protein ABQJ54_02815 [Rhodanobacter sp. Si-c]|uniref:Uncharacterized protein n=1 Tax=Rhodanobacter lycopersici TaxID=3162487 RepID=A0ABV3QA05_9GAMM